MKLLKYLGIGLFLEIISIYAFIFISKNLGSYFDIITKESIIFFCIISFIIYFIFVVKKFLIKKIIYLIIFLSIGFIIIYQSLGFLFFSGLVKDLVIFSIEYLYKTFIIFILLITIQLVVVFIFILIKKFYEKFSKSNF